MDDELTRLLDDVNAGRPGAYDALTQAVHDHLRQMARQRLTRAFGRDLAGVTIQPTVLVHDTLLRLIRQRQKYDSAGHFFAIASELMQRVLLDYCRRRRTARRGGHAVRVWLNLDALPAAPSPELDFEALHGALRRLAVLDPRKAEVVTYRIMWGLTIDETAAALGVGHATIERDWQFAKAWLSNELTRWAS